MAVFDDDTETGECSSKSLEAGVNSMHPVGDHESNSTVAKSDEVFGHRSHSDLLIGRYGWEKAFSAVQQKDRWQTDVEIVVPDSVLARQFPNQEDTVA